MSDGYTTVKLGAEIAELLELYAEIPVVKAELSARNQNSRTGAVLYILMKEFKESGIFDKWVSLKQE